MRCRSWFCFALLAASGLPAEEQRSIHVGPVYANLAAFPELQVLVDVPPSTAKESMESSAFSLRVDNGTPALGTRAQSMAVAELGTAAAVVLDVSGSMQGGPLNAIRGGLTRFASQVGAQDKAAIVTIADDTRWDTDWNDSAEQVHKALANLKGRGKLTCLFDGLVEAAGRYPDTPLARRLVVISDGHDEGSQHTLDDAITAVKQQHITVDSIGMTRDDPKHLENLHRLSSATGGLYRMASSLTMLEKLVGDGIERYHAMPVVTFRAVGVVADGRPHNFLIAWNEAGIALEAQVEAQLPGEVRRVESAAAVTVAAKPADTLQRLEEIPKMWLWIVAGVLAALLLGLIAFLVLHRRKPASRPLPVQPQPPQQQQPAFQQPQTLAPAPFPQQAPPPPFPWPPAPQPEPMSTFMPLPPPEPAPAYRPPPPIQPPLQAQVLEPRFRAPSPNTPAGWLVCIDGPAAGQSFPINEAQYWIGANANNHLKLEGDQTVSGNHACLVWEQDSLGLYDHHSTNGVLVNGERLSAGRRALEPGDRLRIGRSTFVVKPSSGD